MSMMQIPVPSRIPPENAADNLRFVLASGSKRRRDIMELAGLTFIVQNGPGGDAEITGEEEPDVARLTRKNAEMKLRSAIDATRNRMPWNVVVVAADTAVAIDGHPLGKPANRSEAVAMLHTLRGRQHQVVTTVAITYAPLRQRGEVLLRSVKSRVNMREYEDDEIERYVATGIPYDRAGAYGVQDSILNPAESVIGCYLNVVGLPLCALRVSLHRNACTFVDSHIYATCAAHEQGDKT